MKKKQECNSVLSKPDMRNYVGHTLASIEKDLILSTLARCGGNRTWASQILDISLIDLRDKLYQYSKDSKKHKNNMLFKLKNYDSKDILPS